MENPSLDKTPYSDLQLETIRRLSKLTQGIYKPYDKDGLRVIIRTGRFGEVAELNIDGFDWMQTQGIDLLDHSIIETFEGSLVLTGLGLGLGALIAEANPKITDILVIEKDQRVVDVILPMLGLKKTTVALADADKPWVWEDLTSDNIYADHHPAAIPKKVLKVLKKSSPNVVCWYGEYLKVANSL